MKKILILGSVKGLAGRISLHLLNQNNNLIIDVADRKIFGEIIELNVHNEYDSIIDAALNSQLNVNSTIQKIFFEDELNRIQSALKLLRINGIYIYLSSNSVYKFDHNSVITESTEIKEINTYTSVKLMGENYIQTKLKNFIIVRLPGIVNNGSRMNFATSVFKKLINGNEIQINSPESKTSNYICATQLSTVLQLFISKPRTIPDKKILNLYTWPPISRRNFVQTAENLMNIRHERIVYGNVDHADTIVYSNYHEKIKKFVSQESFFSNVLNDLSDL